jgi:hypothetical protein
MTTLGEAFIDVHANTKPFAKELGPKLRAILAETEKVMDRESLRLGGSISKNMAQGIDRDSDRVRTSFRKIGNGLRNETSTWERTLSAPFQRLARGNFILTRVFGSMALGAGRLTKTFLRTAQAAIDLAQGLGSTVKLGALVVARFGEIATGVGKDATLTLSKMSATAAQAAASFAAFAAEAVAAAPAIAATVAIVLALGFALTAVVAVLLTAAAPFAGLIQLGLLIPAALSAIIAVVIPMIIAFKDLSDVMDLVFEKDPKKLEAGLKKLSPVMQTLVMTLRPLRGLFTSLVNSVQTGLIGPILTILAPALQRIIPQLSFGFTLISTAIGNMVLSILRLVTSQPVIDAMVAAMGQIALFIETNTPMITKIIESLGMASEAALPTVLALLTKFTEFLAKFGEFIEGAITDGRFQTWLQNGIADLHSILNLVGQIFGLFKDMFVALEVDGREFLNILAQAIKQFRDWIRSPEGKKTLQDMALMAKDIAKGFRESLPVVQKILSVVSAIWGFWHKIISNPIGSSLVSNPLLGNYSGGGVVPQDQVAMVHQGEPILDPANSVATNRGILADAGMLDVLSSPTTVNVYIGAERLNERIDYRLGQSRANAARALAGTRS